MSGQEPVPPTRPGAQRWFRALRRTRFTQLLVALSLLLLVSPVASALDGSVNRIIVTWLVVLALSAVLVAAAAAVIDTRKQARMVLVLAGTCLCAMLCRPVMEMLGRFPAAMWLIEVVEGGLTVLFLTYVVCLIVRFLFQRQDVTYDIIAASLCGYLLIGVIFSVVYSLVVSFDVTAVAVNSPAAVAAEDIHFGDHRTASSLYFSFVSLTTLGYGDITPVTPYARTLAMLESVLGILYLATLVSRLVAAHRARLLNDDKT